MLAILAGATALIIVFVAPAQGKRERRANPGNLGSVLGKAHGGDTILLASGNYGTFSGAAKKSTVTIKPAPGARATIQLELHTAAHLRFGVQSSARMSSYLYTTPSEIDALVEGLEYTRHYFGLR